MSETIGRDDNVLEGSGPSRRTILKGAVVATASGLVIEGCSGPDLSSSEGHVPAPRLAAPPEGVDHRQRFLHFIGIGDGQIVAIQADGTLLWFHNAAWASAGSEWANRGQGYTVGSGWAKYVAVLGSNSGTIFAVTGAGEIHRYEYVVSDLSSGAGRVVGPTLIDSGWDRYTEVIGFDGDFYGRRPDGGLEWSHYDATAQQWTYQEHVLPLFDFTGSALYADTDGVLYGTSGPLRWYRHVVGEWQPGSGSAVHDSLGDLYINGLFFTGSGVCYAVVPDMPRAAPVGQLAAYRLTNYRDAGEDPAWANAGAASIIARGWTVEPMAALQGYPIKPSARVGEPATIAVSTTFRSISWSVLRLGGAQPAPVVPAQSGHAPGRLQLIPDGDFLDTGCQWKPSISVDTSSLESGIYAVRLRGPHDKTEDIPFIVTPGPRSVKADIAFLVPTLTHHAYNNWGGHSQYCRDLVGQQRRLNLARPSRKKPTEPTGRLEHTLYSDIMLLQWFHSQGYSVDVYDDVDLHRQADLFAGYQIAVLGSHPEYWSLEMRQGLFNHLFDGGNLVYAGGNGIYEAVRINVDRGLVTFRESAKDARRLSKETGKEIQTGTRQLMSYLGYPGSPLLGVAYKGVATTYRPYKVVAASDHPLLAGTGLTHGSLFGARGYNRAASGWETDGLRAGWPGLADQREVIASGTNPHGLGADMVYRSTGFGGHVFSASSITFVGSLAADDGQSRLFKNVFDAMLASPPPRSPTRKHPMPRTEPIVPASKSI